MICPMLPIMYGTPIERYIKCFNSLNHFVESKTTECTKKNSAYLQNDHIHINN